jgi:hypothetical protein
MIPTRSGAPLCRCRNKNINRLVAQIKKKAAAPILFLFFTIGKKWRGGWMIPPHSQQDFFFFCLSHIFFWYFSSSFYSHWKYFPWILIGSAGNIIFSLDLYISTRKWLKEKKRKKNVGGKCERGNILWTDTHITYAVRETTTTELHTHTQGGARFFYQQVVQATNGRSTRWWRRWRRPRRKKEEEDFFLSFFDCVTLL